MSATRDPIGTNRLNESLRYEKTTMKTWFTLALALSCSTLGACGARSFESPQDSQTHWLSPCVKDSECGQLECICGVCTNSCSRDAACDEFGGSAVCAEPDEAVDLTCSASEANRLCVDGCTRDAQCSGERECFDGKCVEGSTPSPSTTPSVATTPMQPVASMSPDPLPSTPSVPNQPPPVTPNAIVVDVPQLCDQMEELIGERVIVEVQGQVVPWLGGTDIGCYCCNHVSGVYAIECSPGNPILLKAADDADLPPTTLHETIATAEGDELRLGCQGLQCSPLCTHGDGSGITQIEGVLGLDVDEFTMGEPVILTERVATSEPPPPRPYALTLSEDRTLVPGEYQYCSHDDQCVTVEDTCSGCCSQTAIASTVQSTYAEEFQLACADYRGGICDCEPVDVEATCSRSACRACEPITFELEEVVTAADCPLSDRPDCDSGWNDSIVIGARGCFDFPDAEGCPAVDAETETLVALPIAGTCGVRVESVVECDEEVVIKVSDPSLCGGCMDTELRYQPVRLPYIEKDVAVHYVPSSDDACPQAQ